MLLIAKSPTSKNLVKLEGIESSRMFTRGWVLHGRILGMLSGVACNLWSMVLEMGVTVLASSSSSEGSSPSSGSSSSSLIGSGADGSGGCGGTTWDGVGWLVGLLFWVW